MSKEGIVFFLSFIFCFPSFGISCINLKTKSSKAKIIYLHGMDSIVTSAQELSTRKKLQTLSHEIGLEIAFPRAVEKCPSDEKRICWMWNTEKIETVKIKTAKILKESQECFKSSAPLIWVGFSNGGNLVSQIFQACELKGIYITFGSSGGYISPGVLDLLECGHFKSFIGKNDKWNYDNSVKFYKNLQNLKGKVEINEFNGGHEIEYEGLKKTILELVSH